MKKRKNNNKLCFALLTLSLLFSAFGVSALNNNIFANAETFTVNADENGLLIEANVDKESKIASFEYWNYLDYETVKSSELFTIAMTPENQTIAEANNMVVSLYDAVDENQCLSIVINTGTKYYNSASTYGVVSFWDDFTIATSGTVSIKGTDQSVVGSRQLVDGAYSSHGSIDIIGWKETATGFFSANGEGDFFPLTPVTLGFNGTVVSSIAHRNDAQKVGEYKREIANVLHNDFLAKSVNNLSAEQHKEIVERYTEEYVNSLFSSGKIKVKITFGGCTSETVSFRLSSIMGETVTDQKDISKPFAVVPFTTQAVKDKLYLLPEPTLYDNVDKLEEYAVQVFAPSGNEIPVADGKFAVETAGTYIVRYTIVDTAGNVGVNTYEIIAYDKLPEVTFTQISENGLQNEYKVYDSFTVPAFEATSPISRANGNKMAVSAVLKINGKIQTEFKDVSKENTLKLTESGEAELVYFATNEYGMVRSYVAYSFDIVDIPLILLSEQSIVSKSGTEYSVPTEYCYYKGNKYRASVVITAPDGKTVTPVKKRFALSQVGVYTLTYSYTVDGMDATAEMKIESAVQASQLFETSNPTATMKDDAVFPAYAQEKSSGLFLSATDETTFTYKNTIDLNELSAQDALLQFLSYSDDEHGKFYGIITLTDAEDTTKKIVLTIKPHGELWQYSYIHVNYDGRTLARNAENGGKISTSDSYGSLMQIPMGTGKGRVNVKQFRLSFDYADKAFYITSNLQTDPWLLLDMDNSEHVGAGRGWEGFTSGKVTVSFTLRKLLNATSKKMGVILTEIAGQSLVGNKALDESAPTVYFENSNTLIIDKDTTTLPIAEKGKEYKLPQATAYDFVDGKTPVNYTLVRLGENENLYTGAIHTFTENGEYVYTVKTADAVGNIATRTFAITVVDKCEKIQIGLSDYDEASVYAFEYFNLPKIIVSGGSGELLVSYMLTLNGKAIEQDKLGRILPEETGQLSICVSVQDYIGTEVEGESEFSITVYAKEKPVAKIGEKPVSLIVGQKNRFFNFEALSYGANGFADAKYKAIKVDGSTIWEIENGVETGSLIYEFENTDKTSLVVQYLAGDDKVGASVIYEYDAPVQKLIYVSDLFIPYDYDDSCKSQMITSVNRTQKGSNYLFSGNKGLRLVSSVTADGLVLRFNGREENYVGQTVMFRLTDAENTEISVAVKIWHEGTNAYMIVNPELSGRIPEKVEGKLNNVDEYFYFEYDETEKKLVNAQGALVAQIKDCENGTAFAGFPSGAVSVSFEVETAEPCGLNIYQISNQLFLTTDNETEYTDILGAQIALNGSIPVAIMSKGETITIPSAVAYDVATGKADVKLTVTLDGFPVAGLSNVSADKEYMLTFEMLGNYGLMYTSTDLNGKRVSISYAISVKDTQVPTIQVNGSIKTEYALGTKLFIPDFEVTDNSGESTCFVWLEMPNGELKNMTGVNEYTLTISGNYTLIIAAFDAESNYTWTEYTFIVK